jgi:predicted glycogen debranching enzyme
LEDAAIREERPMNLDTSNVRFEELIDREWLATNGLGGFASSTVVGMNTRKYHGLLVAAMLPPVRRMVLLSRLEETVLCDGWPYALACNEYPGTIAPEGHRLLRAFSSELYPRWAYQGENWTLQKELRLIQGENTVCISYTLLAGTRPIQLEVRPLLALRGMHDLGFQWNGNLRAVKAASNLYKIAATTRTPELFFAHAGQQIEDAHWYLNTIYRREVERGYSGLEDLWNPGITRWSISPGQTVHFVCSTDPVDLEQCVNRADSQYVSVLSIPLERPGGAASLNALVSASEKFLATSREHETAIVTDFPWAPPSGRDAMIAFPGLLLVTGRLEEARSFLLSYARLLKDGLLPSAIASDGSGPVYESADASLWFINCVHQYLRYGGELNGTARLLYNTVEAILEAYEHGTGLGITTDETGLIGSHARNPHHLDERLRRRLGGHATRRPAGRTQRVVVQRLTYRCSARPQTGQRPSGRLHRCTGRQGAGVVQPAVLESAHRMLLRRHRRPRPRSVHPPEPDLRGLVAVPRAVDGPA